jgi:hypothetical protein
LTLRDRLAAVAAPEAIVWLDEAAGSPERKLFLDYSAASRHFPHQPLGGHWTQCEAARAWLLASYPATDAESFRATCDKLCAAADVNELIAFYKALPLLPFPKAHRARAAEGVRTNISDVFCAVAHHNPYPSQQFDDVAWNTMVLKALFIQVPLAPIVGLDERSNPALMRMLCDYAHERWAASRTVSPELWRCVGPHADESAIADLNRVIETGNEEEREAARRALEARG